MLRAFAPALALLFVLPSSLCTPAAGQLPLAHDAGCVQQNGSYHCNWSSLKLAFDRAHTVAVEAEPRDRAAAAQVAAMATQLGKTRVEPGMPADLTLLLLPTDPSGVNLGPGDHDLATLRVYAPGEGSPRGVLLWAETLRGQGDRPWPAEVHALVTQFQNRFAKR